jgi:oxygen-dependent protoporphyrinogen oxidase
MAAFVRRRLGREAFERLVEPLVSAVYAADMEKLSVEATLPRFRDMEREHGSLIRAMRAQRKRRPEAGHESGARYSMFVTLRDGLSSLVEALAARLPPGSVRLNSPVGRITPVGGRWLVEPASEKGDWSNLCQAPGGPLRGKLDLSPFSAQGEGETFDAVIVATPSYEAARLLAPTDPELAAGLARIEHSGTAIVSLGYDRRQVAHPLDGMGAVVPSVERSPILACSFSSQKYPHRCPEGKVLLRVFVGGARQPELAEMPDEQLRTLVLAHLEPLLGISGQPEYCNLAHWPRTMPQYHVGHRERVAAIEERVRRWPGLALAGNAYHGVGIPDCIHGGETAAERVLAAPAAGPGASM